MKPTRIERQPDRNETRWVWGFIALVMALTTIPYLIGFFHQNADWYYTGFLFGVQDGNSYIAKMLTGSTGSWLFRTPYTAYPLKHIFLFFPYILLGKLVQPPNFHDPLVFLYHLYRIVAGSLMIKATYDFIAVFIEKAAWRRFTLILAIFGGGFGWLSILGFDRWMSWGQPLESYSPEGFGFLSIFGIPHLAAARALMLWGLRRFLVHPYHSISRHDFFLTILIWFGIGLFQPIIQAVGLFVVGFYVFNTLIWQLWRAKHDGQPDWQTWHSYLLHGLLILFATLPIILYTFLVIKLDPAMRAWESQTYIGSPTPLTYLLGYGIALPLAIMAIRPLLARQPWQGALLAGWLVALPFLAYAPFSSQRRLIDGIWVVMVILAVYATARATSRLQKRLMLGWLCIGFPMTLFLLVGGFMVAGDLSKPLFRPTQEVRVFEYLARNARPGEVVLAAEDPANPMPAWAPVRTLNGHGPESLNGIEIRRRIACFYSSSCSDTDRLSLISEFEVNYVFWGPEEREHGSVDPAGLPYLQEVFRSGEYSLYRMRAQ